MEGCSPVARQRDMQFVSAARAVALAALLMCVTGPGAADWADPLSGEELERLNITECKIDRQDHSRHKVGDTMVSWHFKWNGHHYHMVDADAPMGWALCAGACIFKAPPGSSILTIADADENRIVGALLRNTPAYNCTTGLGRSAWLGVTDILKEDKYVYFVNGSEVQFTRWAERQPNNDGDGQDCIRILQSGSLEGRWEDIACNKVWRAQQTCICKVDGTEYEKDATFLGSAPSGRSYYALRDLRSWEGCRLGCHHEVPTTHSHMVIPRTTEEQQTLLRYASDAAKKLGVDAVWVGATDLVEEGNWWWLDATNVTDVTWIAGQPEGNATFLEQGVDEDCMLMSLAPKAPAQMSDEFCGKYDIGMCVCEGFEGSWRGLAERHSDGHARALQQGQGQESRLERLRSELREEAAALREEEEELRRLRASVHRSRSRRRVQGVIQQ